MSIVGEVFVLCSDGSAIRCCGTSRPKPVRVDVDPAMDPFVTISAALLERYGEPLVLHSTSWRYEEPSVILTFIAVVDQSCFGEEDSAHVRRGEIKHGTGTEPPDEIAIDHVLEHGLRHLAWLANADEPTRRRLPPAWMDALSGYPAEPFRTSPHRH